MSDPTCAGKTFRMTVHDGVDFHNSGAPGEATLHHETAAGRTNGAVADVDLPVPGQIAGHLPQHGPDAEAVRVHQHPRVPPATVGEGGESVGLAVRGGDVRHLGGHEFACRG